MTDHRDSKTRRLASAIDRDVLWILHEVRRRGPLPLPELRRQYREPVVTVMLRRNELRAFETDAGVLYALGPMGYELTGAGRWNQPEPNALVHAFARRAAFEWWRQQGYGAWALGQGSEHPIVWQVDDLQRAPLARYAIRRDPEGSAHETVCYLARFPAPTAVTVRRVFESSRRTEEIVVFTTRPQAVLRMKHVPWYVRAVAWLEVAEALPPSMNSAIRKALAAKGALETKERSIAPKAKRARPSSARKATKTSESVDVAPAPTAGAKREAEREAEVPVVVSEAARKLLADLQVDRVTTLGFAQRRYGVTRKEVDAVGILVRPAHVAVSTSAQNAMQVDFLLRASEPTLARMDVARLRHLAGVTALRHELEAPIDEWASTADAVDALLVPDALWRLRGVEGVFRAIEFDAGSYSRAQVSQKMVAFQRQFGMQHWGIASEERVRFVKNVLLEQAVAGSVRFVQWW